MYPANVVHSACVTPPYDRDIERVALMSAQGIVADCGSQFPSDVPSGIGLEW